MAVATTQVRGPLFVSIEGPDGVGKSTVITALRDRVRAHVDPATEVVFCREPGGTLIGERLRGALFGGGDEKPPHPFTELLVFAAARNQMLEEIVRPALSAGAVVISDRYTDSTIAYQHYGRGVDLEAIRAVQHDIMQCPVPDLTILFDTQAPGTAQGEGDYIEREGDAFQRRVREGYREMAALEPERWRVITGTITLERLTERAWSLIAEGMDAVGVRA